MPTTKKRQKGQDRKRVSSQGHEINYTGGKVSRATGTSRRTGKRAVKRAKRTTGTVSRRRVERRAREQAPGMQRSQRTSRSGRSRATR